MKVKNIKTEECFHVPFWEYTLILLARYLKLLVDRYGE